MVDVALRTLNLEKKIEWKTFNIKGRYGAQQLILSTY